MHISKLLVVLSLAVSAMGQSIWQGGAVGQGTQTVVTSSSVAPPPNLQITTNCPLPNGQVGNTYRQTFNATGGTLPYTWTQPTGSLPTGLSFSTGTISGTASAAGTFTFGITVTDSSAPPQTVNIASCSILINTAPPPPVQISTTSLPAGFQTLPYSQGLNATGGTPPYSWIVISGGLPSGLSLTSDGTIGGTPTTIQSNNFSVQATDSGIPSQSATQALSITINAAPPPVTGAQLPINWVNPHECDGSLSAPDVARRIGVDYPATITGLNQSMIDWVAAPDQAWKITVPHGSTYQGGFVWRAKTGATKCIVYVSDTPLPAGQTACSHGIQDNHELVASTTDPGYRNPGCDGHSVEYQNGTLIPIVLGNQPSFNDKASMYTLYYSFPGSAVPAISCAGWDTNNIGCHHIAMFDVEVAPSPDNSTHRVAFNSNGIDLNVVGPTVKTQFPQHIHFNRFYFHSDIPDNPVTTAGTYSGIGTYANFWCGFCSAENGYTDQIGNNDGAETHVFGIGNAPGPLKIVHNWIESGSINIMSGGAPPPIAGLMPFDIEERRNRFTKPAPWMNSSLCSLGNFLDLKSDQEFKVGQRILLDGNIWEYSCAPAQDGQTHTFTVRDACPSPPGTCDNNYPAAILDMTETNSIARHAANGIQLDARSGGQGNGGGASLPGRRWVFNNILMYDIGDATRFASKPASYSIRTASSGNSWNTCLLQRNVSGTVATVDCTASPQNTTGGRQLQMVTGDLISVTACASGGSLPDATPASFQTGGSTKGSPVTSPGLTSLIVTYPNAGTPNKTALCTVNNGQGFPDTLIVTHLTVVGQSTSLRSLAVNGSLFSNGTVLRDSILAAHTGTGFGGTASVGGTQPEGTVSENLLDTSTLDFRFNVYPERTASKYTEYGGAHSGATPPFSIFFPANIPCATANATTEATCVGFTGEMSGAGFNMNPSDYHSFVLHSTSPFAAAGSKPASDGTDRGANITAIDNAETQTQYVCSTDCTNNGANHGPYPD